MYPYLILEEKAEELKKPGLPWCEEWIGPGLTVATICTVTMDCPKHLNLLTSQILQKDMI